jgi:hypothetical protein
VDTLEQTRHAVLRRPPPAAPGSAIDAAGNAGGITRDLLIGAVPPAAMRADIPRDMTNELVTGNFARFGVT